MMLEKFWWIGMESEKLYKNLKWIDIKNSIFYIIILFILNSIRKKSKSKPKPCIKILSLLNFHIIKDKCRDRIQQAK